MKALRTAIAFLTIAPVGPAAFPQELGPARAFFPLVGLLLGGLLALADWGLRQVLPLALVSVMVIVLLLIATRAIHVEGFADCCDALVGGFTRERRLEIMRDSHVGAFAVVGVVALLLWQWAAIDALGGGARWRVLLVFPCFSRCGMLAAMQLFPYARASGMGASFQLGANNWQFVTGVVTAGLAAGLLLGASGLFTLAGVLLAAAFGGAWISSLLGGLTGDGYGALNEVGSVVALTMCVALFSKAPSLFNGVGA